MSITELVSPEDMDGRERTKEEPVFGFEKKSLVFVCDTTNFLQHPLKRSVCNIKMIKCADYIWRRGLHAEELLGTVDYSVGSPY